MIGSTEEHGGTVILSHSNISILNSRNVPPPGASFSGERLIDIEKISESL